MDVLGHYDVSVDAEPVGLPNSLECRHEYQASVVAGELRLSVITAESQQVNVSSFLETFQSPRHGIRLFSPVLESL
jgi:hypothetical protein